MLINKRHGHSLDYPKESVDSVIDLLISLSPKQIIVYDLSNGKSVELLHTIYRIFEEQVKFIELCSGETYGIIAK